MKIFKKKEELTNYCKLLKNENNKIGFVPTMGALHEGHLSLIEKAKAENDIAVVSIFVNPRQFNDISDYENYPQTLDADISLLEKLDCDILFYPSPDDIYNDYSGCEINFHGLDKIYEGEFRPGHFQGVIDIVYRLFTLINPDNAYFGKKDFQQLAIIKLMVNEKQLPINIVACEIIREKSGLALSSRNKRLSTEELIEAAKIYEIISKYSQINKNTNIDNLIAEIKNKIDNVKFLKSEYICFADTKRLEEIKKINNQEKLQLLIAVYCGKIRLIDNIEVKIIQ